jgi:chemotaxis protein CheX
VREGEGLAVTIPDVKWLNPFVVGALSVLASFGIEAERAGQLTIETVDRTSDAVTIIVPMIGALEGAVFYGLDADTAERLAGTLIGDLRRVRFNDALVESALAELGNIITGRASAELEAAGMRCNIAPPIVALESQLILAGHPFDRLVVPVRTSVGMLHIRLALRETAA